jgi:hypothetical protein
MMLTIAAALRAHLLGDTAIAALVAARVYPLRLPQKPVLPAIVLTQISSHRSKHLRGAEALARARYQVDAWAATFDAADALGTLCRRRLNGYAGTWTDGESPETAVLVRVLIDSEMTLFEEDILGGLCRYSADYFLYYGTSEGVV